MELPLTLEIAKKYGWKNSTSNLNWFRKWLEGNFDFERIYEYKAFPQPIGNPIPPQSELGSSMPFTNTLDKIFVVDNRSGKTKLYVPVKNKMIPKGDGTINGLFVAIKLTNEKGQQFPKQIGYDFFKFERGWSSFSSPTYSDRPNGIFGGFTSYTILGVFKNETNNFMNWNDNPLR